MLAYFKIIVMQTETDVLARYFYLKAIALFFFYALNFRFQDLSYTLKVNNNSGYGQIAGLFVFSYCAIFLISLLFGIVSFILGPTTYFLIYLGVLLYLFNDAIEGFIVHCRLFYKYKLIIIPSYLISK